MLKINSLKQVYSSLYKKYQLKEVYNNLFEYREEKTLRHNLKGRNTNVDFFNETQEVSVPGVGTFQLNKFQTALIALVIEFYFGNKKVVKDILKEKVFNDKSNLVLETQLDANYAYDFLENCITSGVLTPNYSIDPTLSTSAQKNLFQEVGDEDSRGTRSVIGYFFELCLCKKLDEFYKTNYRVFFKRIKSEVSIRYIVSVLKIIYILKSTSKSNIKTFFNKAFTQFDTIAFNKLYKLISFPSGYLDEIIDSSLINDPNVYFKFAIDNHSPLDLVVKYNDEILAMLDLKSSETQYITTTKKGYVKNNKTTLASDNKNKVNKQIEDEIFKLKVAKYNKTVSPSQQIKDISKINQTLKTQIDSIDHNDFSIGILRITYKLQTDIDIKNVDCIFNTLSLGHNEVMQKTRNSYALSFDSGIGEFAIKQRSKYTGKQAIDTADARKLISARNIYKCIIGSGKLNDTETEALKRAIKDTYFSNFMQLKNPSDRLDILETIINANVPDEEDHVIHDFIIDHFFKHKFNSLNKPEQLSILKGIQSLKIEANARLDIKTKIIKLLSGVKTTSFAKKFSGFTQTIIAGIQGIEITFNRFAKKYLEGYDSLSDTDRKTVKDEINSDEFQELCKSTWQKGTLNSIINSLDSRDATINKEKRTQSLSSQALNLITVEIIASLSMSKRTVRRKLKSYDAQSQQNQNIIKQEIFNYGSSVNIKNQNEVKNYNFVIDNIGNVQEKSTYKL